MKAEEMQKINVVTDELVQKVETAIETSQPYTKDENSKPKKGFFGRIVPYIRGATLGIGLGIGLTTMYSTEINHAIDGLVAVEQQASQFIEDKIDNAIDAYQRAKQLNNMVKTYQK